ncbi:MAG: hypothetical protein ACXVEF_30225 [Polyangiales bacterium]
MGEEAYRPAAAPSDRAFHRFHRGKKSPRGVVWFGLRSFWGHLQHFIASAIATEDIDSRDWMQADDPHELRRALAHHLAPQSKDADSLTESLERDLWIDYVSDTGDDASVSEAVAGLLFAPYELPDPQREGEHLQAPRGDLLVFGGDTAYPVATAGEIHDRVIVPFNKVLTARRGAGPVQRRAVLAIPGNHDWYDGLDGFGRVFRRRVGELAADAEPSVVPERESRFEHVVDFVEKFVVGGQIQKQKVLVLDGYVPFQHASYFGLPLAPGIDLFAADRQLRAIDFRQRRYFSQFRDGRETRSLVVLLPDPVYSFLEESPTGKSMVRGLELELKHENHFVLAGDIHHYERRQVGASLHVVAGGGGAFLHPARLAEGELPRPEVEWPGVIATRSLLRSVPLHVALGRAGFIPHLVFTLMFAPAIGIGVRYYGFRGVGTGSVLAGVVAAIVFALIADIRHMPRKKAVTVGFIASLCGAVLGFFPAAVSTAMTIALRVLGLRTGAKFDGVLTLLLATFTGAFLFGLYLATLTGTGLESSQAFTCLGHPGFKHFLRMRVRRDGSGIDVWCLGLLDPLAPDAKPLLVDRFTWKPGR